MNHPTLTKENLESIFHAYDVRGRTPEELDEVFFEKLGKAFVTYLNAKKIAVGYDIRPESKIFSESFIKGALSMGCDVVKIGEIATEMLYFKVGSDETFDGGATVTASHNPSGWNGCKMVGRGATALSGDKGLGEIKDFILEDNFVENNELGNETEEDIYPAFKQKILSFLDGVDVPRLKLVVDAGNGIGGKIYDYVFGDMDLDVTKMYFEPDGDFPNHVPNPQEEENVAEIKAKTVELGANVGIAIDGDADRVFFIDSEGRNPSGTFTGTVFAREILKEHPGEKIIGDPKLTRSIVNEVKAAGGVPLIIKTGHSFFKQKMKEENAIFGCELSSHIYYRDFYNADSGMVSIAMMLRYLAKGMDFTSQIKELFEKYPNSGEVNFKVDNTDEAIKRVEDHFSEEEKLYIDGVSIESQDWRCNIRMSNTQPLLRLNVEASSVDLVVEKFKEIESIIDGERDNEPQLQELK